MVCDVIDIIFNWLICGPCVVGNTGTAACGH